MSITKTKIKFFIITTLFLVGFSFFSKANAQEFAPGDVKGFAWMGQNIVSGAGVAQGGGGWINMNCKLSYCDNGNWGVSMNLSSGAFSGYAWSSNYGWLSFNTSQVASCWQDNGGNSDYTATASLNGGQGSVPIDGWAKFLNGDDIQDGYDGCVKFKGQNFSSMLNQETGSITGWAWGGPVVGWISFNNSECNGFCDTAVVLEEITGCMDPSAPNYNPLANVPGPCDEDGGGNIHLSLNPNPTTFIEDSLPYYQVDPNDPDSSWLPDAGMTWVATGGVLDSCVGGNVAQDGITIPGGIGNWTGVSLPNPGSPIYKNYGGFFYNILEDTEAPSTFIFEITCFDEDDNSVSASAAVQYIPGASNTEPPSVDLMIISPNINPPGGSTSIELLSTSNTPDTDVTLKWSALNVNNCVVSSIMYDGNATAGVNTQWDINYEPESDDPNNSEKIITNMNVQDGYLKNTIFKISCVPDNTQVYGSAPLSDTVCVGLAGIPFTQCSATTGGSNIPQFIEI